MCIRYIRRYNNCSGGDHVLESRIPCSNPIACAGEGFGTRYVTFPGSCEQHTSPNDWATFDSYGSAPTQDTFQIPDDAQNFARNISRYVDSLLDFLFVLMNATATAKVEEFVSLPSTVEIIARELRCPRCDDDVTVCLCRPGQNRAMYNVSRAFRTAEAQRLLPILTQRFGEDALQAAADQPVGFLSAENRQGDQKSLLYSFEPPSHETAVAIDRKIGGTIQTLKARLNPRAVFNQGDEFGRVQWSAINIIVSYVKFDSGVPEAISEHIARAILPMLYPRNAFGDKDFRFTFKLGALGTVGRSVVRSTRLTESDSWATYQNMIQHFSDLEKRNDQNRRDLNETSNVIATRMEDLRQTFHDLHVDERDTFHNIVEDLLPITKHVTTEELERNLLHRPARCIVCNLPFSTEVQEPATPALGTFPVAQAREQQVHNPVRYEQCAFVPSQHAFCLREFGRLLMNKHQHTRKVIGAKPKTQWRCKTCYVDPWRKFST